MNKAVLVLGASTNPSRYSYKAIKKLSAKQYNVYAVGLKNEFIDNIEIKTEIPQNLSFHTILLYLNSENQKQYYNKIIELKPSRVIFNPNTENEELMYLLTKNGINYIEACALVLLSINQF